MKRARLMSTVLCAGMTCALAIPTVASASAPVTRTTPQSEVAAVRLVHWVPSTKAEIGNGEWNFVSSGLPASSFVAPYYAVPADPLSVSGAGASVVGESTALKSQDYNYVIPLTPKYVTATTAANMGPIGVMLDGGVLFNPFEANGSTAATSDNFSATANGQTATFLDSCDGHPGGPSQYHYHGLPTCLVAYATGQKFSVGPASDLAASTTPGVNESVPAARKPVVLGFAFDGFAIYDNIAMSGATIPVSALDACNGIFSPVPGYPHGIYHYVLENVKGARSSINCYHGLVSSAYTQALGNALGTNPPPPPLASGSKPASASSLAASASQDALLLGVLVSSDPRDLC